ncbi:MAG: hypothetical protein P8181_01570 [bacterium]
MKTSILVVVPLLIWISGCRDSAEQPLVGVDTPALAPNAATVPGENTLDRETKPRRQLSRDEEVIRNCYLVRDAAEEWSRENGGGYPAVPWGHENTAGHTLIDLLPGGGELENPYTGDENLPLYLTCSSPGRTEYLSYAEDGVGVVGYMITGWGEDGELVQIVEGWPGGLLALDAIVLANCRAVQHAAEDFAAQNGGIYANNTADKTPAGNTLIDFLPGGSRLRNPYHWCRTEPVDGASAQFGETGYVATYTEGTCTGYCITGTGRCFDTVVEIVKDPNEPEPHRAAKVTVRKRSQ